MRRPVFVAGRGAVSALGAGLPALLDGIFEGRRGVRPRERTSAFRAPTHVAGEFPAELFEQVPELELPLQAALSAAREALDEARIGDPSRLGLILASTKADLSGLREEGRGLGLPVRLAHRLVAELGLQGIHAAVSTACASGLSALAMAERRIASGEVDRVLVIGADGLTEFVMAGFGSMHILDPEACRPFDAERRGISMGEAGAAVVLSAHETESVGIRFRGHGGANDAIHVTGCDREGMGVSRAVTRALAHAELELSSVDLLHLHGTGTTSNDASEAVGLSTVFEGPTPPAFGTKAQTGHTLGAGGVLESLITMAALQRGQVPANVGLVERGVDLRLSLTGEVLELPDARIALKVASGFGGIQQVVVFER